MMEDIYIKVFLSMLFGGILGMEREYHDKPAGYATNCLICLGAALFTLLSEAMGGEGGDPGRIAAQIVTGVGFIGAGSILHERNKISGLTTAAGVWLVAAIGMTIGYGQYFLAALATGAILLVQLGVRNTTKFVQFIKHYGSIYIVCDPKMEVIDKIVKKIEEQKISILKTEITKHEDLFHVNIVATFTGKEFNSISHNLLEMPEIHQLYK